MESFLSSSFVLVLPGVRRRGPTASSLPGSSAITGIVGIYTDPRHVILHTSNGEARQEFSTVLTARPLSGQPTPSSESSDVRWVPPSELPGYTMDRSMRIRINDLLARKETPVIT